MCLCLSSLYLLCVFFAGFSLCPLCLCACCVWFCGCALVLVVCLLYVCAYGLSLLLVLLSSACGFLWLCIPPPVRAFLVSVCVLSVLCCAFGCWCVLCLGGVVVVSFVLCFGVFVCKPRFCVWFWVCGGLFCGGCLGGLVFGVVGFWVWCGGFVLWGGCWWWAGCRVVWVGVVLWAILLLLFCCRFSVWSVVLVVVGRGVVVGEGVSLGSGVSGLLSSGVSGSVCGVWVPGSVGVDVLSSGVSGLLSGVGVPGVSSLRGGVGVPVGWGSGSGFAGSSVGGAPGFGGVGVGGGFVEEFWGSGSGFAEPSSTGVGVGGVSLTSNMSPAGSGGGSAGVLDVSDIVLPSPALGGSTGGSGGFGVVGGAGVRFGSSPGFGGSVGGVDGLLGLLGCSPVGLFPVSGVCGVGGFVDGGWVGGVDFSGVGVSGFGGVGVGSGDFVGGSGVSVSVPWLVSGLSGLDVLGSAGFGVSGFGVDVSGGVSVFGLPVGLGVDEVGGLVGWWGLSSAGLGVLGGSGVGSGLGRVLWVYGLGSGGFVPGVSGVDVSGGVVEGGVGAVVDVDGWLWRSLVFGAGLVPAGFEVVSGSGVGVVGGVSGGVVEGGLWGVGGVSGVFGGGAVYGGCPVGLRVGGLGSARGVGDVVGGLSGVGGVLGLRGVSSVFGRVAGLGSGVLWELLRGGLVGVLGSVGGRVLSGVVGSVVSGWGGVDGGLGLGFVAGSEGFGSPVGEVVGGGGSAGLFGRSGWGGVCGGWVDVPVGSPVLGLGVSVGEVVSVLGG